MPCQVLASLYAQVGEQLLADKVLCRGLLADACAPFPTEVFVLSSIVREGLISPLLTSSLQPHQQAALAARIRQQLGFSGDVADWAAKAWTRALGRSEATPPARVLGRVSPKPYRKSVCQKHAAAAEGNTAESNIDSLLRSVLRAFQPLIDRIVLFPQTEPCDLLASMPLLCDGLVGVARIPGFDSAVRWIGFCHAGVHFVGFTAANDEASQEFIQFTALQTAQASSVSNRVVAIGDLVRLELRCTTLRSRDLTLLINALREVVAVRCRLGTDTDAAMSFS